MKKMLLFSLMVIAIGCTAKNHKVTLNVKLESTNGKEPLILECYKAQEIIDFFAAQNKAFMESKVSKTPAPKPIGRFESKGTPEHDLNIPMDMPEDELTCVVPPMGFIPVRKGEKAGQIFKPTGDSVIKVSYNMFTKSFYNADSGDAKFNIVK